MKCVNFMPCDSLHIIKNSFNNELGEKGCHSSFDDIIKVEHFLEGEETH